MKLKKDTETFLFEDKGTLTDLPTGIFSNKEEIVLYHSYKVKVEKKSSDDSISCYIKNNKAKCTDQIECPNKCILFAVKKPWVDGGYSAGIESDKKIR